MKSIKQNEIDNAIFSNFSLELLNSAIANGSTVDNRGEKSTFYTLVNQLENITKIEENKGNLDLNNLSEFCQILFEKGMILNEGLLESYSSLPKEISDIIKTKNEDQMIKSKGIVSARVSKIVENGKVPTPTNGDFGRGLH